MEPKRIGKQFIYGVAYITAAIILIYIPYTILKPAPTCFDGKRNQDETEVDCGGVSCMSCEIKRLKPVEATLRTSFAPAGGSAIVLIRLSNPNSRYGAKELRYNLDVLDANGNVIRNFDENTFVYPGDQEKYILKTIDGAGAVPLGSPMITFGEPKWESIDKFRKPDFTFRQVGNRVENGKIIIRGNIKNNETLLFNNIEIGGLFYSQSGALSGASRTSVQTVKAFEERAFTLEYPSATNIDSAKTRLFFDAKLP